MAWLERLALTAPGHERCRPGDHACAFLWGYGHYALFAALGAFGAGVQAQLHLAHADGSTDALVSVAAAALPVAIALASIAWLQQAANGRVREATWLYLGALITLVTLPLSSVLPPAPIDALVALVVVGLVTREVRSQRA